MKKKPCSHLPGTLVRQRLGIGDELIIGYIILPMAYIRLFARSIYVNVLTLSIILYYVRKLKNIVFKKMTLTCSGLICLIENKVSSVTINHLACVISILVFRKDLS